MRSEAEAAQKLKRRKKRKREKLGKDAEQDGVLEDLTSIEDTVSAADELGSFQVWDITNPLMALRNNVKQGEPKLSKTLSSLFPVQTICGHVLFVLKSQHPSLKDKNNLTSWMQVLGALTCRF